MLLSISIHTDVSASVDLSGGERSAEHFKLWTTCTGTRTAVAGYSYTAVPDMPVVQ